MEEQKSEYKKQLEDLETELRSVEFDLQLQVDENRSLKQNQA